MEHTYFVHEGMADECGLRAHLVDLKNSYTLVVGVRFGCAEEWSCNHDDRCC